MPNSHRMNETMKDGATNDWTYKLFPRTLELSLALLRFIPILAKLRRMKPPTDAQPLPPILALSNDHLLDRMETLPRLDLKKYELIPARRDAFRRDRLGLWGAVWPGLDRVQLQRTAPLFLPSLVVRERHVQDVRDAPRADHVVVVEEMAAFGVGVDGHVLLGARERAAAGHVLEEGAECKGVEGIAKGEEVGEEGDLGFGQV